VIQNEDGTAWHVFIRCQGSTKAPRPPVLQTPEAVGPSSKRPGVASIVPGAGLNCTAVKTLSATDEDNSLRETLRLILSRQDMMEACQAELMHHLEILGRQVSTQQQGLQESLETAKLVITSVEAAKVRQSQAIAQAIAATGKGDDVPSPSGGGNGLFGIFGKKEGKEGKEGKEATLKPEGASDSSTQQTAPSGEAEAKDKKWYKLGF